MPENSWEPTDTPCLAIKLDTDHEEEEKFNKGRGTDSSQIAAAAVALKQKEGQGSQFFYTGCRGSYHANSSENLISLNNLRHQFAVHHVRAIFLVLLDKTPCPFNLYIPLGGEHQKMCNFDSRIRPIFEFKCAFCLSAGHDLCPKGRKRLPLEYIFKASCFSPSSPTESLAPRSSFVFSVVLLWAQKKS